MAIIEFMELIIPVIDVGPNDNRFINDNPHSVS